MMFDAAAVATAEKVLAQTHAESGSATHVQPDPVRDSPSAATPRAVDEARHVPREAPSPAAAAPHEIIFIDTGVSGYEQLAARWASRGEVVLIDSHADGLAQVEATLAHERNVSAIHIVSHGEEGALFLGSTRIDRAAIDGALKGELAQIGAALNPGGDILLYGCDFAEGADGAAALHSLAVATGRDVAASTDLTGAADRGGDWTLEAHDGAIEARTLDAPGWEHVLGPNVAVPIAVKPDSLTVTAPGGAIIASQPSDYTNNYTPAVTQVGTTAVWTDAAQNADGTQHYDLKATVVALSSGDQIQFYRPGQGANPDDATFLITDNTTGNTDATVSIQWQLVLTGTSTPAPANIEFTIGDIDGIDGSTTLPSRESVSTSTDDLAYYTHEKDSDIHFDASLSQVVASGTKNENTVANQPESSLSNATFDWTDVSAFTLNYRLTANNGVTNRAQFYQDGNATLVYTDPQYVSIPRLDLDGTATGTGTHSGYTENGAPIPVATLNTVVTNPMPSTGIEHAEVVLTNAKAGDVLSVTGTLPSGITASVDNSIPGEIHVNLAGAGDEAAYRQAIEAISYSSTSDNPDTTQRDIAVDFSNDTLTSNIAHSLIDVTRTNDPPATVGTLADRTTQDAAPVSYATAGGFQDVDGDTLAYTATGLPAGLSIDRATGVISGTVDHSASQSNGGHYTVTVTATDPSNTSATQTFSIDVTNPAPVAVDDTATTPENTPAVVHVLDNDSDDDPLTVVSASAGHGSVVRNADGTITYTPDAHYVGNDAIAYRISDGQGGFADATVAVTVSDVPPVRNGTLADRTARDADTVSYATKGGFTDTNGDTLTYSAAGLPAGLAIDRDTGVISGTIDRSASQTGGGHYTVTVTATDPANGRATQSFAIDVTNPPPTAHDDSATTPEQTAVVIPVLANDTDPDGDPLTVTAASAGHGAVVRNADGTLTYTPDAHFVGSDTIAYTISDGQGGTSSATVAVTVTDTPPAPSGTLANRTANDADTVSYDTAAAFTDANGDTLAYSATGLPTGLTIDRDTGTISGTLDRSASQANGGHYTVTVTATDPANGRATQSFAIDVANPPPVAADDSVTTPEDTAVVIPVLANDRDPDGDPLAVTAASASHGTVVRNADGTLTYTPDADYNGSDTIAYTISDGQGGIASAVVAVTITPVNDAPRAAAPLAQRSTADSTAVSWATAQGFADVDGDTLHYSATDLPAGLAIDRDTGIISGTIDHSASQAQGGHYTVTVTATDPSGATATQDFAVDIANPAPHAGNDRASTRIDTPVTVAVLANDGDPDGDPIAVTAATAGHGSVAINPDGTVTYTPTSGFAGTDTVDYTITDGDGATARATVTVTVGNQAPATAPIGNQAALDGQAVSLPAGTAFTGAPTYSASGLPAGLAIDPSTGIITGTIDRSASQVGGGRYDTIVTAVDGHGGTSTTEFHWTITNPAPTARNDTAATDEDTPVTIAPLANDTDPDGDPLSVEAVGAAHGSVAVNPDGTITYTPDADFNGTDTIRYTANDGQGGRSSATITVTVRAVDDAPVSAGLAPRTNAEGGTISAPLGAAFSDVDGDALTYTAGGLPAGLAIDPATGTISGTLAAGDATGGPAHDGRHIVTVTATDPAGKAVTSSFVWTVTPTGPTARGDTASTPAGTPVRIDVLANDSDPDGRALTLTGVSATHGTAAIVDGAVVFTPDAGYAGPALVTYTVTDGAGRSASADAAITVVAGDRAPVAQPIPPAFNKDGRSGVALDAGSFFTDPEGDALTYTATGLPPGLSIDPATGRITGTIAHDASAVNGGVFHTVVTATDPSGLSATSAFDWTISNPAPTAYDDSATTREGVPFAIPVLANDVDPDGDALIVTSAHAGHGTVAIDPDGTIAYTPTRGFSGTDTITYAISDGNGGRSTASVVVTVTPDLPPVIGPRDPVDVVAGRPVTIDPLRTVTDPEHDPLTVTGATAAAGTVAINPDGTLTFVPDPGFTGTTSVSFTVDDGHGGTATGTIVVRVTPEPTADVTQLLAIGRGVSPAWQGPRDRGDPFLRPGVLSVSATLGPDGLPRASSPLPGLTAGNPILVPGGMGRSPFPLRAALDAIRSLDGTRDLSTDTPVGDAVAGARALDGIGESEADGAGYAVTAEVARLGRLADFRDAAERLFAHRWQDVAGARGLGDFGAHGFTGFSAAGANGGVMIETLVERGAIYVDVRDTAPDRVAPIRSIDVTAAGGGRPAWLTVDKRGFAIVEADALTDEVRLAVTVVRTDGTSSTTPVVIQRATGEIEIDRHAPATRSRAARPLDATLHTPHAAHAHAAAKLTRIFQ